MWWCLWWLLQILSLFSYISDGVYLTLLTQAGYKNLFGFLFTSWKIHHHYHPACCIVGFLHECIYTLQHIPKDDNFYLVCIQNQSLRQPLHCNACYMEHPDHENLSLCILFTFLTCHWRTCLLFLSVLSPFFQINVIIPNIFILRNPLFFLREIKWHCLGRVFIALWHAITKYILGALAPHQIDSPQYNYSPFYHCMTPYQRPPPSLYRSSIYQLFLSLSINVFSCNLFLAQISTFFFINTFLISGYQVVKNNFSVSLFSSSRMHQSYHLDGCQATGINSFLICAFWAFLFW